MRSKILSLLLLLILLAGVAVACAPQATPITSTTTPTTALAPTAASPTQPPAGAKTLTVLAASSLTDSFTELGKLFESQNPGVTVSFSFAGSQQLVQQLSQGADADVFASASTKYMDAAVTAKRVNQEDARTFVTNHLIVIFPKGNTAGLKELKDLAKPGLKLDLADKSVPVGQYALDFLSRASKDPGFDPQFSDNVLKNVVSYESDDKSVVTKVSLGEADAGIVYATDITADTADKISKLDIPDAFNTIAVYPIAPISDSRNADLAKAFIALVLSPDGQQIMAKYGFVPAAGSSSSSGGFTITDALGRKVTFNKTPQRIVLAGKALFMVADAIYTFPEASKNIVALGSTAQGSGNFIPMIDPTFKTKLLLDQSAGAEQIAGAKPDCVIMKSSNAQTLGKPLEAINIPVVYVDFETPDQYQRDLKTLGQLFQDPTRASAVASFYQYKVKSITQAVSTLNDSQKPHTLILYYNNPNNTVSFNVPPMSWMQTSLVTAAGGLPVWQDANPGSGWTTVNLEQIAAWNPDVIFIVSYFTPVNDVVTKLKADSQWQALSAVKNDKIYGFATDVYSWDQPDTRWVLGLTWVASKLHPDLFPGLDITKEAQAFYQNLYGMDEASFQKNIQPLLTGDVH
jgi:molybdenum ABC transporter molybdate-binding protein